MSLKMELKSILQIHFRENIEDSTRVDSIKSLQGVYEDIRTNLRSNFNHVRVPVVEDCNPDVRLNAKNFNCVTSDN